MHLYVDGKEWNMIVMSNDDAKIVIESNCQMKYPRPYILNLFPWSAITELVVTFHAFNDERLSSNR